VRASSTSVPGPAPEPLRDGTVIDGSGCLATPGLINTHHHLYQWITRGIAQDGTLFGWLTTLYPLWAGSTRRRFTPPRPPTSAGWRCPGAARRSDHHYVFPAAGGDLLEAEITAAQRSACAFIRRAGRWTSANHREGCRPTPWSRIATAS
jgi:hypothetical protein